MEVGRGNGKADMYFEVLDICFIIRMVPIGFCGVRHELIRILLDVDCASPRKESSALVV